MFGYPVCQETADSAGVQLDKCLAVYKSGTLGNAMCLPAIGLVLLATLSSAKMRSRRTPSLIRSRVLTCTVCGLTHSIWEAQKQLSAETQLGS